MLGAATKLAPPEFLASAGRVFARFDTQDSGNISFGVETAEGRFFVKTAGTPTAAVCRCAMPSGSPCS